MNVNDPQDESSYDLPEDQDDGDPRNGDDEVPPPVGDADVLAWVVAHPHDAVCAVDDINTQRERVARIKASCAEMVKRAESDLREVETLYAEGLKRWAAKELEGKKRRSILLPTGKLQFTKVKRHIVVRNETLALLWASDNCTQAIKTTEKFLVSEVPPNIEVRPEIGLDWEEEHDSFKIGGAK